MESTPVPNPASTAQLKTATGVAKSGQTTGRKPDAQPIVRTHFHASGATIGIQLSASRFSRCTYSKAFSEPINQPALSQAY